jgi:hypothetical protein
VFALGADEVNDSSLGSHQALAAIAQALKKLTPAKSNAKGKSGRKVDKANPPAKKRIPDSVWSTLNDKQKRELLESLKTQGWQGANNHRQGNASPTTNGLR